MKISAQDGVRPVASAVDLTKTFGAGSSTVPALRGIRADFRQGQFTAIMGPSGSGKTTFLQCLAGLERPTSGGVFFGETDIARLPQRRLTELRRDHLGFVFQAYNLVPTLTALENITLGERIGGPKLDRAWMRQLIDILGLADRLDHRPSELSGGQQQRVAIARALVHRPAIVFADEPTGNLDSRTGADVLKFLREAGAAFGQTIVMVTHDPMAAVYTNRVLFLRDGAIVDEMSPPTTDGVLARLGSLEGIA